MTEKRVVLGIDPGFSYTGYSIALQEGQRIRLIDYGYLSLPTTKSLPERIGIFYAYFIQKIQTHAITHIAIETPFLGKNAQTFLKLGYLRGIIYLMAQQYALSITEFSPREVKQSVTGFGGAQKDQVARVIMGLFPGLMQQKKTDVTDAIAVTLCGIWAKKDHNILQ